MCLTKVSETIANIIKANEPRVIRSDGQPDSRPVGVFRFPMMSRGRLWEWVDSWLVDSDSVFLDLDVVSLVSSGSGEDPFEGELHSLSSENESEIETDFSSIALESGLAVPCSSSDRSSS